MFLEHIDFKKFSEYCFVLVNFKRLKKIGKVTDSAIKKEFTVFGKQTAGIKKTTGKRYPDNRIDYKISEKRYDSTVYTTGL